MNKSDEKTWMQLFKVICRLDRLGIKMIDLMDWEKVRHHLEKVCLEDKDV